MRGAARPEPKFWNGKRVLLTGHTGFKGAWMAIWLNRLGAAVTGIGLPPATTPSLFNVAKVAGLCRSEFCDIRDFGRLEALVRSARPEVVLHLAAQPLVRVSYRDPLATYATNVMGTAHILEALRTLDGVCVAILVTTDKVYGNRGWNTPHREEDALGGHDPYSASKAASEIVIASYRDAFLSARGVSVASARAGNVVGGGDWSEDRLLPDAIRAWQSDSMLEVRHPDAIRPWQHVLEALAAYLTLAQRLWEAPALAGAYNFGPHANDAASVRVLVELARSAYGDGGVCFGEDSVGPHEAGSLLLDVAKAREVLGITPRWTIAEAVSRTMAWYRAQARGDDARTLCLSEIDAYEALH